MNGSIAKSESTDINSRLLKLRTQIYKPYKSVLSTDNQQQQSFADQNKNYSLQLKQKKPYSNELSFQGAIRRKKTMKLPLILKKKKSVDSLIDVILPLATAADFVADPFLNGRIRNQRELIYAGIDQTGNQYRFLRKVQELQLQFLQNCSLKRYKQGEQVITRLLNIAIDLNLIDELGHSIMILADFHFECLQNQKAFFFYNESHKCGMLIGQHKLMAESLIKMSRCANRANLHNQAIRILKKALQYIWFYDLVNLELTVYDEIGKAYYQMGDIEKAQCFHYKFFTGSIEPQTSSIKLLSKESLILQGLNQKKNIRNVSTVFLWMIHIPIKSCHEFEQYNQQMGNQIPPSPRKFYEKDMKYFQQYRSVSQAIIKLFADPFFKSELGEMHFNSTDWTTPIRKKKFLSYDIKRNNHLKSLGIPYQDYFSKVRPQKIKRPEILRKIKTENDIQQQKDQPKQQKQLSQRKKVEQWLTFVTSQAVKKYRANNTQMSNKVNIRGIDKHFQPKISSFRILFNQYFDFAPLHGAV